MSEILPKNIKGITFGLYSAEEISKIAVCEITNNKLSGPGSVYDERMGPLENNSLCVTCGLPFKDDPGHFGKINLSVPILHPMHYKMILSYLKVVCFKCYDVMVTKEQLDLWEFTKYSRETRLEKIIKKLEKINICGRCQTTKEKVIFSRADSNFFLSVKNKKKVVRIPIETEQIKTIFDNIPDESVKLLGFNVLITHPRNLIITVLPVIPTRSRPFIISENVICDDDLTTQYIEIIKADKHLQKESLPEIKRARYLQILKFRIKTLFDNGKAKARCTNGRALKGIKERLTGKLFAR